MEKRKVNAVILFVVLCLLVSMHTIAGNLEPSSPPGPTMKTLDEVEPRIPIPGSATPTSTFTISQSGSYYLTGNRICSSSGIQVDANDVTIDLMGFSLVGPGSGFIRGISIPSHSTINVEIRNGTIRDFGWEGVLARGKSHRILNIRALSNSTGIRCENDGMLVKDCTAYNNAGSGIWADNGGSVINNVAFEN